MTFENFSLKRKNYDNTTDLTVIKSDSEEISENLIIEILKKEIIESFGENVKFNDFISDENQKARSIPFYRQTSYYPDLINFNYHNYIVYFGLNSTRAKMTIRIYDKLLNRDIESFGPKLKKLSTSQNIKNCIKKVNLAFKYLLTDEVQNHRISKSNLNKYNM